MKQYDVRVRIISIFFLLFSLAILIRLFNWQVVKGEELSLNAKSQQQIFSTLPAHRGSILAGDDYPLASSTVGWLIWASVGKIKEPQAVAKQLALIIASDPIPQDQQVKEASTDGLINDKKEAIDSLKIKEKFIKEEQDRLEKLLSKTDVVWIALKHKATKAQKEQVEALGIEGIGFNVEEGRVYPEGFMASHLLGFAGQDSAGRDKGYFGLEGYYNLTLQGSEGTKSWEKDAKGEPILVGNSSQVIALNGLSIKTYIDRSVQFIIEKNLKTAVEKYKASSGTVLVLRPKDGAILGIASFPSFDPGNFKIYSNELFINPAISQSFEPGSIFKPLIMSAALDAGVVDPDTKCDNCTGPRHIAEYTIESGTKKYYPNTTMSEIIQHSDNIGMIWVSEKLGLDKMYDYLNKFGIGKLSGIDLQGEISPSLRRKDQWGFIDMATTSFGQGIAVTSIQMVRAMAAIANGGKIPKPEVVSSLVGDGWEEKIKPELGEQVISQKAAREVTDMMVNNVDSRDDWQKPKGFKVAGKTGTAQIPVAGHYDPDKTVHSFIGFAPAYSPQYVMLVTLKDPKAAPYAAQTAAPVWFSITQELLVYLGAQQNEQNQEKNYNETN